MTDTALPIGQGAVALAGKTATIRLGRKIKEAPGAIALTGKTASLVYTQSVGGSAEQRQFLRFFSTVGSLMTHV